MMAKVPPRPSGKGAPPEPANIVGNLDKPEALMEATLNFKVNDAFKADFKPIAAQDGKHLYEVLQEAFALYKAARQKSG